MACDARRVDATSNAYLPPPWRLPWPDEGRPFCLPLWQENIMGEHAPADYIRSSDKQHCHCNPRAAPKPLTFEAPSLVTPKNAETGAYVKTVSLALHVICSAV